MNKLPIKSNGFLVRLFSLLLVLIPIIFIVNSCRKDVKQSRQQSTQALVDNHINITLLQSAYNKEIKDKHQISDISQQTIENIIGTLNVDWTTYSLYTYPDSTQIIEFAMPDDTTLLSPHTSTVNDSVKYFTKTSAVFILRKDTISMSFFMKTVEKGEGTNYQSIINYVHYQQIPTGFTGNIYYFTFGRQYINGYSWENGNVSKALSLGITAVNPPTQTNNANHKRTNEVELTNCTEDQYDVYLITNGNEDTEQYLYSIVVVTCDVTDTGDSGSSPGGVSGGGSTPPTNPCSPSSPASIIAVKGKVIDYTEPLPGSGGGTSPSPPPPCPPSPTKPPVTTKTTTTVDPCVQKKTVSSTAANSTLTNKDKNILAKSTTNEYGMDENLTTPNGTTYKNTLITTDNSPDSWTGNFTWNSTDGYTIGFSHAHPAGSAPSPADIFSMLNLSNPDLVAAGPTAINFYKTNVSITVLTKTETYVVTINDWTLLQEIYNKYNADTTTFDDTYSQVGLNYENDNPSATTGDAGAYALMELFADSINIYEAPTGTTNFQPVTINTVNGKDTVTIINCPN